MTEIRPERCMPPEFPVPSIVDYRPNSTLVSPRTSCPRRNFPSIDFHGHPGRLLGSDGLSALVSSLDALNVRLMVSADNLSGDGCSTRSALTDQSRTRIASRVGGHQFQRRRTRLGGTGHRAARRRPESGRRRRGRDQRRVSASAPRRTARGCSIDDPDLDPIWDACARLKFPVFIHTADPQEFFEPIDLHNERWLELSLFADRRYPADRAPRSKS